jgi:NAD(P)-dependent dehydrogenase (short-subunit alcohol dehydrogenase family)
MSSASFDFTGATVLITGASYGLGAGFAEAFARAGASLALTARTRELLEHTADICRAAGSPKVTVHTGDVSVEADVIRVVGEAVEAHGRVDVLVNNAGIADMRGLAAEHYPSDTFDQILAVDLKGAFLYLREVGRQMLHQGKGSIVNISSIMGDGANEMNVIAYTAAKGGLRNLTMQLGCEWADRGVRVNAVSPGFIVTEMTRAALEGLGMTTTIAARTPMRRVGELEEVTNAVLFLASDASSYITGVDLRVDGGTNAANGYYQVAPIHHEWNKGELAPVGRGYPGFTPRPEWLEALAGGIPGIHYPLPEQA